MPQSADLKLNRIIATRVRSARIGTGSHQPEFAARLGIRPQDLQAYETERQLIPAVILLRVAAETGFALDWFLRSTPEQVAA